MRRRRVLVFIKGLGIGGAEKLISEGAQHWDRSRFEYRVAYVLPWKDQLVPDLEEIDVPVTCVGTRRGLTPTAAIRVRTLISRHGIDLVHAHLPSAAIAVRMVSAVPIVYTEHNLAHSYREPTRTLNRLTYRRNAAVTAVSEPVAASVADYPGPPVRVIPNGVSVAVTPEQAASARRELGLAPDDPLVVHVGNLRPGKGHETLISAAALLGPGATVVSIGGEKHRGDLARVRRRATQAGVDGRLRFLGRRPDAAAFIAAADVYVNPADFEGLPVSILEAMALGRPVVATAVGGVPAVVRHGDTGLLVDSGDSEGLAAAVARLIADPDEGLRLGRCGRAMVEAEYGLDKMVRDFERIYDEVLGG